MISADETIIENITIKYNWHKEFRYGAVGEKKYVRKSNSVEYDTKEFIDILTIRIKDIQKKLIEIDIETDFKTGTDIEILERIKKEITTEKIMMKITTYALVQVTMETEMEMKDEQEMLAEAYNKLNERIGEEFEGDDLKIEIDSLINIDRNSKGPNIVISKEKDASILVEGEYNEK